MEAIISYTVYNSIVLSPILLLLVRSKRMKALMPIVYYICLAFIITLVSIRFQVGRDFSNYERIFTEISSEEFERMEIGFRSLILSLNQLGLESQWLFFVTACIIYSCVFKSYYKIKSALFIIIWFLVFFLPSLNQLRQYMALAVLTLALIHFEERKKYIFLVIIATSFHYTGLVGFIYLILAKLRFRWSWLLLLVSPIFIYINLPKLILSLGLLGDVYYAFYLTDENIYAGMQTLSLGGITRLVLPFLFVFLYRKDNRPFITLIKNSMIAYVCLYFLSINFYILYRIYIMFMLLLPFAAYIIYTEYRGGIRLAVLGYTLILFLLFQKSISDQTIEPANGNSIYPYQTIFNDYIIRIGRKYD
ncbi:EpsG family protein [Glaesserella parasuis]|uniref:EpsG family protein n=1 Tax=Glaesserella parasuis TaxID=738 RepID=UPI001365EC5B|nr:EpsG family protein [Glaesserella parasuis]MDE3986319.1 EpsG family protein [Glaesserella parasuis]MDG6264744.1 EpsG family protein [Glaesserella parasuis]MDG6290117.1 EpsG family protein [Glaesserella parasuis]MDG6369041.1 EpsG family protein [Glaesserella parasuis]MDG6464891.1 EpsG family protein [Glaesserella parasuis]